MLKLTLGLIASLIGTANAQGVIQSPNYIIQMPNLNSGAGIPSSSNYNVGTTIGQTGPGLYSSSGYRVKSGFQYIYSIIPFSFTISSVSINFGSLIPQTPATSTNTLTVASGGAGGYQVKASENTPLKLSSSASTIPNTNCDSSCTNTTAGVWSSTSRYGFGFNMSGDDIPADFVDLTYFRPFADRANSESPQIVMSSIYVGRGRQSTVTYKVNISGVQPAGTYNNIITFTAIPSY
ncbi:MAG: hypothetical protein UV71_C0002G0008 [Microgenomates group bacterium GW2011_GWC1_43_13]|uniref:Uncharacterized protein n=2 Tax=Candidatus Woeseibacteriota TaxID=1752722 RepID=A0A837IK69_9BACT|nr:MAG: hypothetical protein UV71_C0002G0008 [Microgenomates group bacterium GW2011_GWC1_43_13]KKT33176.1 MAG: hypothetical protein UW20_C0004G0010 [Candidatus Woesebacteria bacterium GW2011_GWB1_44_11]KKT54486.1 MAG: hypothetical protein UW47_C0005G0034 [Candidatus Woesebacteria bacterium GW2011_GWA1_44_23]OGM82025.1 MAG: hypothetical protein A2394_02880 [Candidatus Woesebacteria bacterium RIFOXYB1_FULL_42_36]OGM84723.1 MAG: hypothetical protein A2421_02875 [Candidatus Woesebacteria bacterium 